MCHPTPPPHPLRLSPIVLEQYAPVDGTTLATVADDKINIRGNTSKQELTTRGNTTQHQLTVRGNTSKQQLTAVDATMLSKENGESTLTGEPYRDTIACSRVPGRALNGSVGLDLCRGYTWGLKRNRVGCSSDLQPQNNSSALLPLLHLTRCLARPANPQPRHK